MRGQPLSYSGVVAGKQDDPYGTVLPVSIQRSNRRDYSARRLSRPAVFTQIPRSIIFIIEGFEIGGKDEGLRRAAEIDRKWPAEQGAAMEAAVEYLTARSLAPPEIKKRLANIRAAKTRAKNTRMKRLERTLKFRENALLRRLAAIGNGKDQAVADLPDVPTPKKAPDWMPYLTVGIAVAGLILAMNTAASIKRKNK